MGTIGPTVSSRFHAVIWEPWLVTMFMLMAALATPVFGRLADREHHHQLYSWALTIFAVGSGITAISPSMGILLGGRLLQGMGAGGIFTLGLILIGRLFTGSQRAAMQGRQSAVWGIAAVLGPTLGGWLAQNGWWWRLLFGLNVPLTLLVLWWLRGISWPSLASTPGRFDYAGLLRLGATLAALMAAPTLWTSTGAWFFPVISIALAVVWGTWWIQGQRRVPDPIIPVGLLQLQWVRRTIGATLTASALLYSLVVLIPLWTREVWTVSATTTGWVVLPIPLGWALGSYVTSRLVRQWAFHRLAVLQTGMFGISIIVLILAGWLPWALVWGSLGGLGAGGGMGGLMMTLLLLLQSWAPPDALGRYTGLYNFARNVGNALGPGLLGGATIALAFFSSGGHRVAPVQWLGALDIVWVGILGVTLGMGWMIATMPQAMAADHQLCAQSPPME